MEIIIGIVLFLSGVVALQPADDLVILQEDPSGQVGEIVVTATDGGSQVINMRNVGVAISDTGAIAAPQKFSESEIADLFGRALALEPQPASSYLIYFEAGSDRMTSDSYPQLNAALRDIVSRDIPRVDVIGHTDTTGSAELNATLSVERAREMANVLENGGIPREIIEIRGHGEGDLLVQTDDGVDEPLNRRVEIEVR